VCRFSKTAHCFESNTTSFLKISTLFWAKLPQYPGAGSVVPDPEYRSVYPQGVWFLTSGSAMTGLGKYGVFSWLRAAFGIGLRYSHKSCRKSNKLHKTSHLPKSGKKRKEKRK
jgi:hypothetical protein